MDTVFTLLGPQRLHWSHEDLTRCWLWEQRCPAEGLTTTARRPSHPTSWQVLSAKPCCGTVPRKSRTATSFARSVFPHLISSWLVHNIQTLGLELRNLVTQRESSYSRPRSLNPLPLKGRCPPSQRNVLSPPAALRGGRRKQAQRGETTSLKTHSQPVVRVRYTFTEHLLGGSPMTGAGRQR